MTKPPVTRRMPSISRATAPPYEGEVDGLPKSSMRSSRELKRFVWMKEWEYRAVALWIMLTYLHDVVDVLPDPRYYVAC